MDGDGWASLAAVTMMTGKVETVISFCQVMGDLLEVEFS